ncbi:MAG: hypothetical protein IIC06_00865 [Proteobacteria bacterium]|nr:hypothetical protein [Pseudomonadota bacterium]
MATVSGHRRGGAAGTMLMAGLFLAAVVIGAPGAAAGGAREFHEAVAAATGHYREGLFYVRRGNAAVAAFELESLVHKWAAVMDRFADDPPEPYARDPAWRRTLEEVGTRARDGLAAALGGEAKVAKEHLEPIRRVLSGLRRRNGVFLFVDTVEEANAAFRELFRFRRRPPDFTDAKQVDGLRRALTATINGYEKCRATAPPTVADDPQFKRLIADSLFYLDRMWLAIAEKNQLNVVNILRRVVSSDDILWLRYG